MIIKFYDEHDYIVDIQKCFLITFQKKSTYLNFEKLSKEASALSRADKYVGIGSLALITCHSCMGWNHSKLCGQQDARTLGWIEGYVDENCRLELAIGVLIMWQMWNPGIIPAWNRRMAEFGHPVKCRRVAKAKLRGSAWLRRDKRAQTSSPHTTFWILTPAFFDHKITKLSH